MKCLMCESLSLKHICPSCQEKFLTPSLYKRKLTNGLDVFSFYKYKEIENLLLSKHTDLGFYIYTTLAQLSFKKFAHHFVFDEKIAAVAVDDTIESGYSHTAILARELHSHIIEPRHKRLRATNAIKYAGKSRAFRLQNPREFRLKNFKEKNVIVVDDIITTGSTLYQATELLRHHDKDVLFCLTLCDVSQK